MSLIARLKEDSSQKRVLEIKKAAGPLPDDFEFSAEFQSAFDTIENTRQSVYLTGEAGTGKTTFLRYFREHTKKKYVVLAPTGIGAINSNGQTMHSFFKFPPKLIQPEHIHYFKKHHALFAALELLVIDEASMIRADLLDAVDMSLRRNREMPGIPFGGVQVALIGDMYQLPPVVDRELADHYPRMYETPYFFSARVFKAVKFERLRLTKIYRQRDSRFTGLLNKIRRNSADMFDLELLNSRVDKACENFDDCITLTPTNALANSINETRLAKLDLPEFEYKASIKGHFDEQSYPTETVLKLRAGAQVLMIRNDPQKRWVNGSLGEIVKLRTDSIQVKIENTIYDIESVVWEKIKYHFDEDAGRIMEEVIGGFEQYPMKLAWAMTIHKSQGLTFDRVVVDFGNGAFASGQTYVALSRCRTFETMYLKRPVKFRDIILDARIKRFEEVAEPDVAGEPDFRVEPVIEDALPEIPI